jgi:two-component system nitrate/nitrite response regulator NarL
MSEWTGGAFEQIACQTGDGMMENDWPRIDVLVLVESEVVFAGLEAALKSLTRVRVVYSCREDTLAAVLAESKPGVLIVALEQWVLLANYQADHECTLPPVLVLGDSYDTHSHLFASLPVDGFLSLSDLSVRSLSDALDRVIDGEMPMPASLARQLLAANSTVRAGGDGRSVSLTPRERETLSLLVKGMSNKQIARAMNISGHGAKRLVGSLLLKLGASNRTAAVITALKAGLG